MGEIKKDRSKSKHESEACCSHGACGCKGKAGKIFLVIVSVVAIFTVGACFGSRAGLERNERLGKSFDNNRGACPGCAWNQAACQRNILDSTSTTSTTSIK